jgi:hypothetical protein
MNCTFSRRKISGLLAIVPSNERSFVEEIGIFNCPGSFYGSLSGGSSILMRLGPMKFCELIDFQ